MLRHARLKIGLLVLLAGCRYFQAQASFQVTVVNAAGEPIPDANILVQKQLVAKSNSQGQATLSLDVPLEESLILEVNKPSPHTFFAPFFETVQIKRGENNFFKVRATLYAVPKGGPSEGAFGEVSPTPVREPQAVSDPLLLSETQELPLSKAANQAETRAETAEPHLEASASSPDIAEVSEMVDLSSPAKGEEASATAEDQGDTSELLTIYVSSGTQQISEASVLYGDPDQKIWLEGCTTNVRGRCTLTVPPRASSEGTFDILVRAQGYQAISKQLSLAHGDRIRIDLNKGESLEVFATQARYETAQGLEGVKVKISGKEVGGTDAFGYFTQPLPKNSSAKPLDHIDVSLEAPGRLPEEVRGSFPAGGSISFVQNFQAQEAPRPRLLLLPLSQSGGETQNPRFLALEKALAEGLREQILGLPPFAEADQETVTAFLSRLGRAPQSLAREGWGGTELASEVDFILRPHLVQTPEPQLEVALIDVHGQVRGAAQIALPSLQPRNLKPLLKRLSHELSQHVSFEGAIVDVVKDGFRINLGKARGYNLKEGELLQIWGMQTAGLDRHKKWGEVGLAKIVAVGEKISRIHVLELKPRSVAQVGDAVRLVRGRAGQKSQNLLVQDQSEQRPLAQADLYFQKEWIGSSDAEGRLQVPLTFAGRRGHFELIRPGYRPLSLDLLPQGVLALERDALQLKIESIPAQALVKLNGRVLGRTPLYQTIQAPPKDSQLELSYNEEYRAFQQAVSPDDDGIDFSGERAIRLEIDIRRQARQLLEREKVQEAIALLEGVAESHPDYALAQHELGEIFLNHQRDPVRAAATFHRVTNRPEIANFSDKRFIGTHINEALALHTAGEKVAPSEPSTAISYWSQSTEILDRTVEQLRFVPQDRYNQALHSLYYYRAMNSHKTWSLTQTQADLVKAHSAWRDYIQNTALSAPSDKNYATLKKAEELYRQTDALLKETTPAPTATRAPAPNPAIKM